MQMDCMSRDGRVDWDVTRYKDWIGGQLERIGVVEARICGYREFKEKE